MSWFIVKWLNAPDSVLAEARVQGAEAVRAKIIEWVEDNFGEDGDQIHVIEEAN